MGGSAFAHISPPLFTPRMPPDIYRQILAASHDLLQEHFEVVRSALEAPAKESYGDIDILIFGPKPGSPLSGVTSRADEAKLLAGIIGAEHHILEKGNYTMNFAIPWPKSVNAVEGEEKKFLQIDIEVCPTLKVLEWGLFHSAHGDLWNILGSTIRKFGLTVNNLGMYLRIEDLEAKDRKKSMILLTDEPREILKFLGLDEEKWWKEFRRREEMFEYAASCRMFWVKDLEETTRDPEESPELGPVEGLEGGEAGKKKLKHNDRQRMAKRPIFKEWIDEFIPKCRAEGRYKDGRNVTREQVRDEAFQQFGPEVKMIYETRLRAWKLETHTDHIWRTVLKGSVPEEIDPQFRAASIRTLKGVIMEGDKFDGKVVPEVARNEEGFWDVDRVNAWVKANWQKAGEIGLKTQQEKAAEGMRIKAEQKRLKQEKEAARKGGGVGHGAHT